MNDQTYFYQFLEPLSKELAYVARELENSIFSSPRTMLTHARIFVENILQQVIKAENLPDNPWTKLKERLDLLNENGYLTPEVRDALHHVRRIGNQAAHQTRPFRYSESLLSWEAIFTIVKWYIEVYGPIDVSVPEYLDPAPQTEQAYDSTELESRLERLEELLKQTLNPTEIVQDEIAVTTVEAPTVLEQPGFTTIRTLTYKGENLEIPYFLRDAFLLPQRFGKSERFLIRLGGEQQARLISELPDNLEGLHVHVTRYNETNDENLFYELINFINEEKIRRQLKLQRPGELFFFYQADHVVVTESLAKILITTEQFTGFPSLIKQLNDQGYEKVGQLPNELVTLAKYKGVGKGTLEKFFEQLKEK
jgi:hypothetical protein